MKLLIEAENFELDGVGNLDEYTLQCINNLEKSLASDIAFRLSDLPLVTGVSHGIVTVTQER